jgi:tRNA A-37 threonylcarbamoyl transferase component Bud32
LEILELLGQGGMGAVYKARQPTLDRVVAVKVLPPEAGRDPAFAERFQREARALARLGHPNIVAVHDVGQAGDFYYFVMEYVDGVNLRQLLRDGQLSPEQALRIVPQICDALQYAHEEGIVHRDIKPENILLDRKGRVKIADFGLAKLLGHDAGNFTLTGSRQVMGTLYYMAPEQVERPLEVDHRADIYSLGVVFYEMLTGQLPVGRFPMPSEKAGTDAFLDSVVLRALEREPERRYQRAGEVKTAITEPHGPSAAASAGAVQVARARLRRPARALLLSGVLDIVFCIGVMLWQLYPVVRQYAAALFAGGAPPEAEDWLGLLKLVAPLLAIIFVRAQVIRGALDMLRLGSPGGPKPLSMNVAAILAVLPFGPGWPIGLPVGIWTSAILQAPDVTAAFAHSERG